MTVATAEWVCVLLIDYADGPPQGRRVLGRGTEAECEAHAAKLVDHRDLAALGRKLEGSLEVVEVPDDADGRVPVAATIAVCRASAIDDDGDAA